MFDRSLSYQAVHIFTHEKARTAFERLYVQSLCRQLWASVTGHRRRLLHLAEVQQHITIHTRAHAGVRLVPIGRIRGSENRSGDFDADFRPLNRQSQARWVSIARAHQLDIALPLVELVQVNDIYFVRDGHHRISVAKALGQREIEAEVIVWHTAALPEQLSCQGQSGSTTSRIRLIDRLLLSLGQLLVLLGTKLQACHAAAAGQPALQRSLG